MSRGNFNIVKVDVDTIQVDKESSLLISKERYQPLGSDFILGTIGEGINGSEQELRIGARNYMTPKQIEAEDNSIAYAESFDDISAEEILITENFAQERNLQSRAAPYEAFHIKGLGQNFTPIWNDNPNLRDYIYLELDLWRTLDIRSASIVCGPVQGSNAGKIPGEEGDRVDFLEGEDAILGWPSFPSSYLFNLELRADGVLVDSITKQEASFGESRFQKKAYLLLGYLTKDPLIEWTTTIYDEGTEESFGVVNCVNSNLIIEHELSNETPVVNISPYFGGGQLSSNYFDS